MGLRLVGLLGTQHVSEPERKNIHRCTCFVNCGRRRLSRYWHTLIDCGSNAEELPIFRRRDAMGRVTSLRYAIFYLTLLEKLRTEHVCLLVNNRYDLAIKNALVAAGGTGFTYPSCSAPAFVSGTNGYAGGSQVSYQGYIAVVQAYFSIILTCFSRYIWQAKWFASSVPTNDPNNDWSASTCSQRSVGLYTYMPRLQSAPVAVRRHQSTLR